MTKYPFIIGMSSIGVGGTEPYDGIFIGVGGTGTFSNFTLGSLT